MPLEYAGKRDRFNLITRYTFDSVKQWFLDSNIALFPATIIRPLNPNGFARYYSFLQSNFLPTTFLVGQFGKLDRIEKKVLKSDLRVEKKALHQCFSSYLYRILRKPKRVSTHIEFKITDQQLDWWMKCYTPTSRPDVEKKIYQIKLPQEAIEIIKPVYFPDPVSIESQEYNEFLLKVFDDWLSDNKPNFYDKYLRE
jgi:hypothetical protein